MNRATATQEMIDFLKVIANYARVSKGKTNFGIFVQNEEALASHADYVQTVSGIGRESVWYTKNNPHSDMFSMQLEEL